MYDHFQLEMMAYAAKYADANSFRPCARPPFIIKPIHRTTRYKTSTFLVRLEGPLDTPAKVQKLAGAVATPIVKEGEGETGKATFCQITGAMKLAIQAAFSRSIFGPVFIHVNLAPKSLSEVSFAPSLGSEVDSTLPHNRAVDEGQVFLPGQKQYPVWYFLYGNLADPETLARLLGLDEMPVLRKATTQGGVVKSWGGKYEALVDGPASAVVDGWAYLVESEDAEETLRYYETDHYEVVRCEISTMADSEEVVKGLVFRFVGEC
ncbi:hypothetical protein BO71DRAFT_383421 [Aspergillus ellipticus CBS 707.79]|uniref:Uncharacterized protein n=1 Tax=Aspergillus ellipticus CBS 707.79 TaxID=1448320 RepID=A0A319D5M3_9EURO|nr:hypothetical protein BO71DRAFT_383421 [Aspergillus ellipticus CBS 707.79]